MIKMMGELREIHCDAVGCNAFRLSEGDNAQEARADAGRRGWTHGAHPKATRTVDVCPEHSREMVKKAKADAAANPA